MNKEHLVKYMVDRFLGWRLPENFNPDCGIYFDADAAKKLNPNNHKYEPVGTNLFTALEAREMVRYMLDGFPLSTPAKIMDYCFCDVPVPGSVMPDICMKCLLTIPVVNRSPDTPKTPGRTSSDPSE